MSDEAAGIIRRMAARQVTLHNATLAQIAAELRRRAEVHDAAEVSETASIADVLFNYNPRLAERLRRVAGRLEAMENGM